MKAELTDISACKKVLDIEIPQDVVDKEISHISQNLVQKARVPGFRPGKAPVSVIKTRYRDEIVSEMLQHLLPTLLPGGGEGEGSRYRRRTSI